MPRRYGDQARVAFWPPEKLLMIIGYIFLALSFVPWFVIDAVHRSNAKWLVTESFVNFWNGWLLIFWLLTFICFLLALVVNRHTPERLAIRQMLRYRLFAKAGGNPLGLKNESAIPSLDVRDDGEGA